MKILIKPHSTDDEMAEIYSEDGKNVYAVVHTDLFYERGRENKILDMLKDGVSVVTRLEIQQSNAADRVYCGGCGFTHAPYENCPDDSGKRR